MNRYETNRLREKMAKPLLKKMGFEDLEVLTTKNHKSSIDIKGRYNGEEVGVEYKWRKNFKVRINGRQIKNINEECDQFLVMLQNRDAVLLFDKQTVNKRYIHYILEKDETGACFYANPKISNIKQEVE